MKKVDLSPSVCFKGVLSTRDVTYWDFEAIIAEAKADGEVFCVKDYCSGLLVSGTRWERCVIVGRRPQPRGCGCAGTMNTEANEGVSI